MDLRVNKAENIVYVFIWIEYGLFSLDISDMLSVTTQQIAYTE